MRCCCWPTTSNDRNLTVTSIISPNFFFSDYPGWLLIQCILKPQKWSRVKTHTQKKKKNNKESIEARAPSNVTIHQTYVHSAYQGIIPQSTSSAIGTSQNYIITSKSHKDQVDGELRNHAGIPLNARRRWGSCYILIDDDITSEKKSYSPLPYKYTPFSFSATRMFTHLGNPG